MYLLAKFDESEKASSFDTLTTPITLFKSIDLITQQNYQTSENCS